VPVRGFEWVFAWAICLSFGLCLNAHAQATDGIEVRGAVKTPLHLTVDDLLQFPADQIGKVTQSQHQGGSGGDSILRGVRLTAILDRAGLAAGDHNDWKKSVVIMIASDGYRVVFSWPELFDTEVGSNVLVVFERDAKPLGPDEGRIALISGSDRRTGPRHVRWLQAIEVRVLAP
jgi:DMSO/TMAO reductase YedYZ molybdopterin-dependent catalytic subunit